MPELLRFEFRRLSKSIFYRIVGVYCIVWPVIVVLLLRLILIPGCDGGAVLLSYTSPDGATGFPGNLDTKVMYCWLEDKTFLILYCGKTDKDTIFAPTNHAYFNLRASQKCSFEN